MSQQAKTQYHLIILIVLVLILPALLGACLSNNSDLYDQEKIYSEFKLTYDSNTNTTKAEAVFHYLNSYGAEIGLKYPSEVRFNGNKLTNYSSYSFKQYDGLIDSGTFEWKDYNGNVFKNSIKIRNIFFPDSLDNIVRNIGYNFIWRGRPLGINEKISLQINGKDGHFIQSFEPDSLGDTNILLTSDNLINFPSVTVILKLERSYQTSLSQKNSSGGTITGCYRPKDRLIELY
jgi:hypothetical protein